MPAAIAFSLAGFARADPSAQHSIALTCWQGGVKIVDETGIARLPILHSGVTVVKADGTRLELFSDQALQALCLLRLPRDLPREAWPN